MTTVTRKTKQILVLCGSLMLTSSAFAATGGEGGDESTPPTPRTSARLSSYPAFFDTIGSMKNEIKINREVRKFIRETYPEGVDDKALSEFKRQLLNLGDRLIPSVYEHVANKILPLYSRYQADGFSFALTSPPLRASRTILRSLTNRSDDVTPLFLSSPLRRELGSAIFDRMMEPSSRKRTRLLLPPIAETSSFAEPSSPSVSLPAIPELEDELNRRIIGEEPAMASLATGLHVHYTIQDVNSKLEALGRATRIPKQNIFMCGPTGCGKTASVKVLAKKLGRTFYEADTSGFTRTGYVGDSASSVIVGLINEARNQVTDLVVDTSEYKKRVIELVQKGIVFLDEFDKIGAKKSGSSERDIAGTDVQSELLKLMEGKKMTVKVEGQMYSIDTSTILFLAGGAFSSIERKGGEPIGPEAFVDAGFSEQVLGRFGRRIFFEGMTTEKFVRILQSEEASPLTQNLLLLEMGYGIHVNFDEDAMRLIAERGYAMQAGVRGLATMVNETVDPLIRRSEELRGTTFTVDRAFVEASLPKIEPRKKDRRSITFEDHIRDHPRESYAFYG